MDERHNDEALGPLVDTRPAPRPERVTLRGRFVSLVPLSPDHAETLYRRSHGPALDPLWTYLFNGPFPTLAEFSADVEAKARAADPFYFAVVGADDRLPSGYMSLMRIDTAHRVVEVGGILFAPPLQGTAGTTEAQYLLARYVFDELGYRRYEWKCNERNAPSKRAALRLGFTFEGVFRQHMIVKQRSRDTAWFSMLDSEWPARRAAFERWLAPDNFDAQGRQRRRLEDCLSRRLA